MKDTPNKPVCWSSWWCCCWKEKRKEIKKEPLKEIKRGSQIDGFPMVHLFSADDQKDQPLTFGQYLNSTAKQK